MEILGVGIAILNVDITILGVVITILGVDIAVLRADIAIFLMGQECVCGGGIVEGEKGGVAISHVSEAGVSDRDMETPRATGSVERRVMSRSLVFDRGGAWFVEEPYDVAPEDVGWLFDFTRS